MIGVLGFKRIVALLLLATVTAVMAASVYLYLVPENEKLERDVRGLRSQISAKRADVDRLSMEFQQIQEQKNFFGDLEAAGFFSDQNRVLGRERIEAVQRYTNILSVKYDMQAAQVEKNPLAEGTGYSLVSSPATLSVEALDDVDFFKFVYWLENGFPGHVSINTIHLERAQDINEATLRQIGSGREMTLVKGNVKFNWRTMMPNEKLGVATGGGANGM